MLNKIECDSMDQKERKEIRKKIIKGYFHDSVKCLEETVEKYEEMIEKIADVLLDAYHNHKQTIIMGNGGSAATASHMACDLSKAWLDGKLMRNKCFSLTDNISLMTAWMNDAGYDEMFVGQLENIMEKGDVVIGISSSGNSPNIVNAMQYAKKNGANTIGFTGFDGGKMREIVDYCIVVPTDSYKRLEDIHLMLAHVMKAILVNEVKEELGLGKKEYKNTVIIERDGVINKAITGGVKNWNDFLFLPGAIEAVRLLNKKNYRVIVATKQDNLCKGEMSGEKLRDINERMSRDIDKKQGGRIESIYHCPRKVEKGCKCTKKELWEKIARDFEFDLKNMIILTNSKEELKEAQSIRCKNTFLIDEKHSFLDIVKKLP